MRRLFLACLTAFGLASGFGAGVGGVFSLAEPVWPEGRERELNSACQFRCRIPGGGTGVRLRATAAYNYRARLNGKFVGYGPLRAEEGVFRVDEWPLDLEPGENELVVEVAGYNCNSYYFVNQPAFFAAEVVAGGKVLAATGFTMSDMVQVPEALEREYRALPEDIRFGMNPAIEERMDAFIKNYKG
jgi:alpha-L-rhamnosidase